jgi:hypothetical protein
MELKVHASPERQEFGKERRSRTTQLQSDGYEIHIYVCKELDDGLRRGGQDSIGVGKEQSEGIVTSQLPAETRLSTSQLSQLVSRLYTHFSISCSHSSSPVAFNFVCCTKFLSPSDCSFR